MRWLDDIFDSMHMNLGKLWQIVRDREAWRAAIHRVSKSQTRHRLNNNNKGRICLEAVFMRRTHHDDVGPPSSRTVHMLAISMSPESLQERQNLRSHSGSIE